MHVTLDHSYWFFTCKLGMIMAKFNLFHNLLKEFNIKITNLEKKLYF